MFFSNIFWLSLAESTNSDGGGIIVILIVLGVLAAIFGKAAKPKGKWVYVEPKKTGCLVMAVFFLAIAGAALAVAARFH